MPADSRDMVEDAARDIWRFFRSEPEWFDANKSLGGPQWLINRLRDLSSPARGEGEAPVAWRWRWGDAEQDARWAYSESDPVIESADWVVQPLYTHPTPATPAGLREKVEEALRGALEWDKARGYRMPYRVRDPIYAALDLLAALQPQAEGE